jgi:hypothetical protein
MITGNLATFRNSRNFEGPSAGVQEQIATAVDQALANVAPMDLQTERAFLTKLLTEQILGPSMAEA